MMTFLPYGADFKANARCLDRPRLQKQRVESLMIMRTHVGTKVSWSKHPCTLMWAGNLNWLYEYNIAIYEEYAERGYIDHTRAEFERLFESVADSELHVDKVEPWWLNHPNMLYTHKGNLYRKKPEHYTDFAGYSDYRQFVCCPDRTCNTVWPAHIYKRHDEGTLQFKELEYVDTSPIH